MLGAGFKLLISAINAYCYNCPMEPFKRPLMLWENYEQMKHFETKLIDSDLIKLNKLNNPEPSSLIEIMIQGVLRKG